MEAPRVDEKVLFKRYAALGAWPADAQFGLLVLAWMLGPGFSLTGFSKAVNRLVPDFAKAACVIGPGQVPTAITLGGVARAAFRNAAVAVKWNLDESWLVWPTDLSKFVGSGYTNGDVAETRFVNCLET